MSTGSPVTDSSALPLHKQQAGSAAEQEGQTDTATTSGDESSAVCTSDVSSVSAVDSALPCSLPCLSAPSDQLIESVATTMATLNNMPSVLESELTDAGSDEITATVSTTDTPVQAFAVGPSAASATEAEEMLDVLPATATPHRSTTTQITSTQDAEPVAEVHTRCSSPDVTVTILPANLQALASNTPPKPHYTHLPTDATTTSPYTPFPPRHIRPSNSHPNPGSPTLTIATLQSPMLTVEMKPMHANADIWTRTLRSPLRPLHPSTYQRITAMKQSRLGMKHRKIVTSRHVTKTKPAAVQDAVQHHTKRRKLSADGCHYESTSDSSESELEDVSTPAESLANEVDEEEDDTLSIASNDGQEVETSDDSTSDEDDEVIKPMSKQTLTLPSMQSRKRTAADAVILLSNNVVNRGVKRSFAPVSDDDTDDEVAAEDTEETVVDVTEIDELPQPHGHSNDDSDDDADSPVDMSAYSEYNDSSSNEDKDDYVNELDEQNLVEPGRV